MTNIAGPFFFVREVGTDNYETGTHMYVVPKLYTLGSANQLRNRRNNEAVQYGWSRRWETVPVTITIGESK